MVWVVICAEPGCNPWSTTNGITLVPFASKKSASASAIESAPPEQPNKIVCEESLSQGLTALRISQSEGVLAVLIPRRLDPTPVWH